MHATVFTGTILGVEGLTVEVEVDLARGIPCFSIVGLPNTAVRESRERVTAAIKNAGLEFPLQRITVNLAPADIKKEGAAFDLAIAMGIIIAQARKKDPDAYERLARSGTLYLGELALDGAIRRVRGVLPVLLHGKTRRFERAIIPRDNFAESLPVGGIEVYGARHLSEVIALVMGESAVTGGDSPGSHETGDQDPGVASAVAAASMLRKRRDERRTVTSVATRDEGDEMGEVVGQEAVKRALTVAAAGGHHVLMVGPPGSGKTMLARRFPTLLPRLDERAALETTMIYSIAGLLDSGGLVTRSPFRAPHHSASDSGLIGGGSIPRPGEVTLAHNGVLFLDELPEFRRHVLETLREPLEEGRIAISRARCTVAFPARFQLVAAMNPCPCGHRGNSAEICKCSDIQVHNYLARVSGPLLDRIAIHVHVHPVDFAAFRNAPAGDDRNLRKAVVAARAVQSRRFAGESGVVLNASMPARLVRKFCRLDDACETLLRDAHRKLRLSARGRGHILRVGRTIADLEGATAITRDHLAEAIQYRSRELPR